MRRTWLIISVIAFISIIHSNNWTVSAQNDPAAAGGYSEAPAATVDSPDTGRQPAEAMEAAPGSDDAPDQSVEMEDDDAAGQEKENLEEDIGEDDEKVATEDGVAFDLDIDFDNLQKNSTGDRLSYGEPLHVKVNEVVDGDAVSFGGAIIVEGVVTGTVASFGGPVDVRGKVEGDVVSMGGPVTLADKAEVDGDVVTMGGRVGKHPGAIIHGEQIEMSNKFVGNIVKALQPHRWGSYTGEPGVVAGHSSRRSLVPIVFKSIWILAFFGLGLIIVLMFPHHVSQVSEKITVDPLRTFAYGLLSYILFILVAALLSLTCVGIPLAVVLLLFSILVLAFGMIAGVHMLGRSFFSLLNSPTSNPVLFITIGATILGFLLFIPFFIGVSIWFLFSFFAVGATVMTRFGTNKPWFGGSSRTNGAQAIDHSGHASFDDIEDSSEDDL
ncbi:hypothetical protein JW905_02810 [bacterium]|nr:hypothetical protein [candidate division CSSED10-310 bacterium]